MEELLGKTIGGCLIEEKLGQGGMGAVYRARHLGLDIAVAVKILLPIDKKIGSEERFLREARTAARLRHPNIVGVLNVGCEDGHHFIIMEYVDGRNLLATIRDSGKLPPPIAVGIAGQILDALTAACEVGIVHRDVKPENILIDATGCAKLADLGLAKRSGDAMLTCSSVALGSPHYIAPEQAQNPRDADHRADIYSLGCTLFHMIAGTPPYEGKSPVEIILDHIRKPVPSLFERDSTVPRAISDAVAKMMEKEPAMRFQTSVQARDALVNALERGISPKAPRPHALWTRRLIPAAAMTSVLLAVAAAKILLRDGRRVGPEGPAPLPVTAAPAPRPDTTPRQSPAVIPTPPIRSPVAKQSKSPQPNRARAPAPSPARAPAQPSRTASLADVIEHGETEALKWLLDKGIQPNVGNNMTTPLHLAVHNESSVQVKLLLERGANPNVADEDGDYPLHYALRGADVEIVKLLLERGADPNVKDRYGATPLRIARAVKNEKIQVLLRERGGR